MSGPTGVLLMAHGAAERVEDLEPYLKSVLGREVPAKVLEEVRDRYAHIGGRSPLLEITQAQARALQLELNAGSAEGSYQVGAGFRHARPGIAEAVGGLLAARPEKLVAVCLTPYYSSFSVGGYMAALDAALQGVGAPPEVVKVRSWHDQPLFQQALAGKLEAALRSLPPGSRDAADVLFTAHSLPLRLLEKEPYRDQVEETARTVGRMAGLRWWQTAWQSRGMTDEPWLGPSAELTIEALARGGCSELVLHPIGFISDHLETLYDDDILLRDWARVAGIRFTRVPSLNADPVLVRALAAVVRKHAGRAVAAPQAV